MESIHPNNETNEWIVYYLMSFEFSNKDSISFIQCNHDMMNGDSDKNKIYLFKCSNVNIVILFSYRHQILASIAK